MPDALLVFALKDKLQRMDNTVQALRQGSAVRLPDLTMANEIERDADELRKQLKNMRLPKM
jgi:hypothetical protein